MISIKSPEVLYSLLSILPFYFSSCKEDTFSIDNLTDKHVCFMISDVYNFNAAQSFCDMTKQEDEWFETDKVSEMQSLDVSDTLYLHTSITDAKNFESKQNESRTTPVKATNFYDSFGMSGYKIRGNWDNTAKPDFMYNEEINAHTNTSGVTIWQPKSGKMWPFSNDSIRFFAFAPYNNSNIKLSAITDAGAPTLNYTLPRLPKEQVDILTASTQSYCCKDNKVVSLSFNHPLTQVRLILDKSIKNCTIKKISFSDIYQAGTFQYNNNSWTLNNTKDIYEINCNIKKAEGTGDLPIFDADSTLMMIPQILNNVELKLTYIYDGETKYNTITAKLNANWESGKIVTYTISSDIFTPKYTLSTNPTTISDVKYNGDNRLIQIISNKTLNKITSNVSYTYKFYKYNNDGSRGAEINPDWIKITKDQDNKLGLKVLPDSMICREKLNKEASEKDLSKIDGQINTSNCYIINSIGNGYSFPLVYGNAIKNSSNNTDAYSNCYDYKMNAINSPYISGVNKVEPILQIPNNLLDNVHIEGNKCVFDVKNETTGNAIIAAKDANDVIMWSWHIWLTSTKRTETISFDSNHRFFVKEVGLVIVDMVYPKDSVMLCIKQNESNIEDTIKVLRKDYKHSINEVPFYMQNSKNPYFLKDCTCDTDQKQYSDEMINPKKYYCVSKPWYNTSANQWRNNGKKGISDPSPYGYKIPLFDETKFFTKDFEKEKTLYIKDGYKLKVNDYFGAVGYVNQVNKVPKCFTTEKGFFWTSDPSTVSVVKKRYFTIYNGTIIYRDPNKEWSSSLFNIHPIADN